MAGFFRRLFTGRRQTDATAVSSKLPAAPSGDEWFEEAGGLPFPCWERIADWVTDNVEAENFDEGYNLAVRLWMQRLTDAVGGGLTTVESPNFILLSPFDKQGRLWVLKAAEDCRRAIFHALGTLAWSQGWGKHLVLVMPENLYAHYTAHYHSGDYMGRSSGMMLYGDGYAHIAIMAPESEHFDFQFRRVFAHELTHNALCRLTLPRWLDEALAMSFEDQLGGGEISLADRLGPHFEVIGTRALLREFSAWWTDTRIQGFWSGELWNSEDDEQAFCYELARILFRIIRQHVDAAPDRFRNFVGDASRDDAGETSAERHLGFSLGEVAAEFFGQGDWTPEPLRW